MLTPQDITAIRERLQRACDDPDPKQGTGRLALIAMEEILRLIAHIDAQSAALEKAREALEANREFLQETQAKTREIVGKSPNTDRALQTTLEALQSLPKP